MVHILLLIMSPRRGRSDSVFVESCFIIIVKINIVKLVLLGTFVLVIGHAFHLTTLLFTIRDLLISNERLLYIIGEIVEPLSAERILSIVVCISLTSLNFK